MLKEIEYAFSEQIFFTPSCMYLIYFGILEEYAAVISALVETADDKYSNSERIL